MILIRTAEEMARALDSPLDPAFKHILAAHWARLSTYEGFALSDLAVFVIVQPGDSVVELEAACSLTLSGIEQGEPSFAFEPEFVEQLDEVLELVFILSDDGFGVVLLVPNVNGIDPTLKAACDRELRLLANAQAVERH